MNNEITPRDAAANDFLTPPVIAHVAPTVVDPASHAAATSDSADTHPPAAPEQLSWSQLGLEDSVLSALEGMGYLRPTAVQATVFGPVRAGKDLLVQSRTGTGKTAAFGLPIVAAIDTSIREVQGLILTPTRELALQVTREIAALGKDKGVVVETLYGGAPIGKQIAALREGVHLVVGTPGRVLDHIGRRTLDTKNIRIFVLDECDEMLSMGFLEDIERVVSHLSKEKQTALFSATMPDEVKRYSRRHMKAPELITLSADQLTVTDIHHAYYIVSGIARPRDLLRVLFAENPDSAIIFCNTRDETATVARFLQKQGLDAEPISSDLSQADRERVMQRCKAKNLRFLVATDVAARGIDISDLSHVINYSVQDSAEVYVHRTGRTGRAGKKGTALSLVGPRELGAFRYVRLQFKINPEERILPPWSILDGKLKVPLPVLGAPIKPDPIAILAEATPGPASQAQLDMVKALLATPDGERVLAVLVAERLSKVMKPKVSRPVVEQQMPDDRWGADRERSERGRDDRGPRGGDRDRGPRRDDRFGGRDDRGPREDRHGARDDRGPRRDDRFGGRDDRGPARDDRGPARDDRGPARDDRGPARDDRGPARDDRG
ncbi:MAG: DEAD/DEAH box helicase, partial [Kofleriaceae bacterium]|nr:DEAD/DEAH box helicase [Kofleriaceae bacterium]